MTAKKIVSLSEAETEEGKKYIASVLRKGGLIIMPSDTVYGCVVDATSEESLKKLISFKARPTGKAISVFVASIEDAQNYVSMNERQKETLAALLPGPYTLILPSLHVLPLSLEAEDGTLGIRIPKYGWTQEYVTYYGKPLTATSANLAGKSPHYSVEALLHSLSERKKEMIDLIIDAGHLPHNKPSTVIDISGGSMKIIRQGDIQHDGSHLSHSPADTHTIAQGLLEKYMDTLEDKPLVFLLYGDLGVGKTEFTKGLGALLKTEPIISPTFVIYYEYLCNNAYVDMLYHFDLYRLRDVGELNDLHIETLLQPRSVFCIEWSEKSDALMPLLKDKATVIKVHIEDDIDGVRTLSVTHTDI